MHKNWLVEYAFWGHVTLDFYIEFLICLRNSLANHSKCLPIHIFTEWGPVLTLAALKLAQLAVFPLPLAASVDGTGWRILQLFLI